MTKIKLFFIFLVILCINILFMNTAYAHNVEIDPNNNISLPIMLIGGEGTVSLYNAGTGYSLYFQGVELSNSTFQEIEDLNNEGNELYEEFNSAQDELRVNLENAQQVMTTKVNALNELIDNSASTEEIAAARTEFEEAREAYNLIVQQGNTLVSEYNANVLDIKNRIKELTPSYVESNWTKTEDSKIHLDSSSFSGNKAFAVWVKLVLADGTTIFDEGIYTVSGTKTEEINIKSIALDKTKLTLKKGESYSLKTTTLPENATSSNVNWISENEKIATVTNGKVTGVSEGTTKIKASNIDGTVSAICEVTVTNNTTNKDNTKDNTTASQEIPKTGSKLYLIGFTLIVVLGVGIISYTKNKNIIIK